MAESVRNKKLVYHLTDLSNLRSMIAIGIQCRRNLSGTAFMDHADAEILRERADHALDQYVPFHFLAKSPFDYAVVRKAPNTQFILIAIPRHYAAANHWRICPRHPLTASEAPTVLEWEQGVDAIDWDQMDKADRNYDVDRECKLACMAEALSPSVVPVVAWQAIYVATQATENAVKSILATAGIKRYVNLSPAMFPKGAL